MAVAVPDLHQRGLGSARSALTLTVVFSGGTSGIDWSRSLREAAAEESANGLVQTGDELEIDVNNRILRERFGMRSWLPRREAKGAAPWRPTKPRERQVSKRPEVYGSAGCFGWIRAACAEPPA